MTKLDGFDLKILRALQEDARISIVELADRVGLSATPCARRVKRLEEEGWIDRYVTLLNPRRLGLGVSVFLNVRLKSQSARTIAQFEQAIRERPEITECYLVTGNYDYLLHIRLPEVGAYKQFLLDHLIALPSVAETSSSIALEQTKYTTALPLPEGA